MSTTRGVSHKEKNKENSWFPYVNKRGNSDLLIHNGLFNRGIFVVEPQRIQGDKSSQLSSFLHYELVADLPKSSQAARMQKTKLYIQKDLTKDPDNLHYSVIGLNGRPVKGKINFKELSDKINVPVEKVKIFRLKQFKQYLPALLEMTAANGHTYALSDTKFIFNERQLIFNDDLGKVKPDSEAVKAVFELLAKFKKTNLVEKNPYIFTATRPSEVFAPLIIPSHDDIKNDLGFYVYPWTSAEPFQDTGTVEYFHTGGCIIGANLQGVNQRDGRYSLVKHNIQFYREEKLLTVVYDPHTSHPYEEMLEEEFKRYLNLIKQISKSNKTQHLLYHLPYYDYILFAIDLFLKGRLSLKALESFCKIILNKAMELMPKIEDVCKEFNIHVQVQSPFENIFGPLLQNTELRKHLSTNLSNSLESLSRSTSTDDFEDASPHDTSTDDLTSSEDELISLTEETPLACYFLNTLGLSTEEVDPSVETSKTSETELVHACLERLTNKDKNNQNSFNTNHAEVWNDFINIYDKNNISNLEDLLKIANPAMVGLAAKRNPTNKTVSLLPLSEKQIQLGYQNFSYIFLKQNIEKKLKFIEDFNIIPNETIRKNNDKIAQLELCTPLTAIEFEQKKKELNHVLLQLTTKLKNNLEENNTKAQVSKTKIELATLERTYHAPANIEELRKQNDQLLEQIAANKEKVNQAKQDISELEGLKLKYPSVLNLTVIDPIMAYGLKLDQERNSAGNGYYFRESNDTLSELITEKKILSQSSTAITLFAQKKPVPNLEQLLHQPNKENNYTI